MKKIDFMVTSFRDGFQSCYGARVKTADFIPALKAAAAAGANHFEIGGGARFQSLYFYCQECAFAMMEACREAVGPDVNLQTLGRGANVVGLISQSRDIIDLHAKLFKKCGVSSIRNFDALNDVRNLAFSGNCIHKHGLKHQVCVTLMGLPPGLAPQYAHSPEFYVDCLRKILDEEIPFDSICFKDASGTTPPKIIYDTIKEARKLLPEDAIIHMHSHSTAGMGISCYMAAIEAGADVIDLAMRPVSGGTAQPDILTMWHRLKGTDYTLDIDYEKVLEAEDLFMAAMDEYFKPPEAQEVNPIITLSPMPGGALTANTQMMRDNNCLHLYPKVIKAMQEVVERGGYGTSVTPVSQFYFQQAFANVTSEPWSKITEGYGRMVLGYFGHTPAEPDPEIVQLASEQLGLEPTREDVHDINDRNPELGVEIATKRLTDAGLPVTEENIFISATCEEKGILYLKGEAPLGVRYKKDVAAEAAPPAAPAVPAGSPENYTVTVDGRAFNVTVAPGGQAAVTPVPATSASAPVAPSTPAPAPAASAYELKAPMPGTVMKVLVSEGDSIQAGDIVFILEAMKMETPVKTEYPGRVVKLNVSVGNTVADNEVIALIGRS